VSAPVPRTMVWVDGTIVPAEDARIRALDHGLIVGDGVFETMKVVGGTPFAARRHLARLHRSLATLGLTAPLDDRGLRAAMGATVAAAEATGTEVGRLRLTITGGPGPLGSDRSEVPPTVVIAASAGTPWAATTEVVTVPWVRNERSAIAGAKTTSYAENVVALQVAHERGASEAIMANTVGALCEGTGSNVFVVRGGRLRTPSLSTGCLAGVTRELVLEVVDCEETDALTLDDLRDAEEAFLTSSTRDVHPIAAVDGSAMLNVAPGPRTAEAMAAFAALEARTIDP